jgi:ribosomal protein L11 methyltransferase
MGGEPRYPEVSIDVAADDVDDAVQTLIELGAVGIEERDESTLAQGPGPGRVTLVGSFADRSLAEAAARAIDGAWSPHFSELVGDAWRDEWKKHFVPFRLTDRVIIRPPWEPYEAQEPSEIVLELEPGRAFGTGLHATTVLVARALEARAHELSLHDVLDVGTGSGILALLAIALGAKRARAIDIDPEACAVAAENARRNGMEARLEVDASPLERVAGSYEVVTANIEARVLVPMAPVLTARVRPGGTLILSGILREQRDEVERAFVDFEVLEAPGQDEWIALVLRRPQQ